MVSDYFVFIHWGVFLHTEREDNYFLKELLRLKVEVERERATHEKEYIGIF